MSESVLSTNLALQNWLQKRIQQPHTVDKKQVSEQVVICDDYGISVKQRLAIYQNGYKLRLLECLRAEYPLLIKVFSTQWFDSMAQRYLSYYPSSSTNLNDLGAQFPNFLQQDRPDNEQVEADPVFDFLISLATLERYKTETSRGQGTEKNNLDGFELIGFSTFESLQLTLAPNLRLLKTSFQLLEYLNGIKNDKPVELIRENQYIAICRENFRTHFFQLKEWQYELLSGLQLNPNVGETLFELDKRFPDDAILGFTPFFLAQAITKGCVLSFEKN